jgi:hypothetical protein
MEPPPCGNCGTGNGPQGADRPCSSSREAHGRTILVCPLVIKKSKSERFSAVPGLKDRVLMSPRGWRLQLRSSNHVSELDGVRGPRFGVRGPRVAEGDFRPEFTWNLDVERSSGTASGVSTYTACPGPRVCQAPECEASRRQFGDWPKGPYWPCAPARWSPLAEAELSAALAELERHRIWGVSVPAGRAEPPPPHREAAAGGIGELALFEMCRAEGRGAWMSDDELIAFIRDGDLSVRGRLDE